MYCLYEWWNRRQSVCVCCASAVRLLTNAHWPSLLHSLVRVMLRMLRDSLFTLKHKHTNYTHIHTEFALSSNGIHSYSFIHQLMPISARRSCLETNAVFSFDTGTDNSLGKRATSSNAIYLSIYVQLFFLESKCPSSDVCLLFEALRVYRSTGTARADRTVGSLALWMSSCVMSVYSTINTQRPRHTPALHSFFFMPEPLRNNFIGDQWPSDSVAFGGVWFFF